MKVVNKHSLVYLSVFCISQQAYRVRLYSKSFIQTYNAETSFKAFSSDYPNIGEATKRMIKSVSYLELGWPLDL